MVESLKEDGVLEITVGLWNEKCTFKGFPTGGVCVLGVVSFWEVNQHDFVTWFSTRYPRTSIGPIRACQPSFLLCQFLFFLLLAFIFIFSVYSMQYAVYSIIVTKCIDLAISLRSLKSLYKMCLLPLYSKLFSFSWYFMPFIHARSFLSHSCLLLYLWSWGTRAYCKKCVL